MNKYQEALDNVKAIDVESEECLYVGDLCEDDFKTLQELVDKETPKKFKIKTDKDGRTIWVCPNCGDVLMKFWSDVETISPRKYCDECGQKLDWGD